MAQLVKIQVSRGIFWVEAPKAGLYILCGCPADSVKHLMKRGLIGSREEHGITFETGPNAILLSDVLIQNGAFSNMAEFPVLQMLYRQGMLLPDHPNNTGQKPLLIGSKSQVRSQMQYIYRGNYGLTSEEELLASGVSPELAHDIMRMKLRFAFGKIRDSEELLDALVVGNDPVEIRNGVYIRRLGLNVFEFRYGAHTVSVDLSLPPSTVYESPYTLGYHQFRKEYFGVIHSGDGDGWDAKRPTMSSVLTFQGKIYLIDAGPNILHSLKALGIGGNEIEGIFHTHAHDDHFSGLPTLMRSDHRIRYFSTPMVRSSVAKKLSALMNRDEEYFSRYFEVHDLELDAWNDIGGLEVKPMLSPHPVETNILLFRAMSREGYKTYAHFSDIVGLDILRGMIADDDSRSGVSRAFYDSIARTYLEKTDLKKVDAGGGMIHGNSEDFKDDASGKIVLSHTSRELTPRQKEIGSGAPFGMADAIISAYRDYRMDHVAWLLEAYFPTVPRHQRGLLANNPIVTFNPETILLKAGVPNRSVYLILSGEVEMIHSESGTCNYLSSGALVGEMAAFSGAPARETCLAASFVQALEVPTELCLDFVKKNGLHDRIVLLQEKRKFLQSTWLFGESTSYPVQTGIVQAMEPAVFQPGETIDPGDERELFLIRSGKLRLTIGDDTMETLRAGDFFGEVGVLFGTTCLFGIRVVERTEAFRIAAQTLLGVPIVCWKLLEVYQRRMELLFNPSLVTSSIFEWREEYGTAVLDMDRDHRELFKTTDTLYKAIAIGEDASVLHEALDFLIRYAERHFRTEENLMGEYGYPERERHRKHHEKFLEDVLDMRRRARLGEVDVNMDFVNFIKDWIINHILTEDRKYGRHFSKP
ncbi:MAG: bacteriohemerythrin [Desulfobacteraceae bacterium]|nr:bacteriohemerythrin [Desulfobacteraceae bacterium]